jgi:hypothetical protein
VRSARHVDNSGVAPCTLFRVARHDRGDVRFRACLDIGAHAFADAGKYACVEAETAKAIAVGDGQFISLGNVEPGYLGPSWQRVV